jgi:hypothetical protein
MAYGRNGLAEMFTKQVRLARGISEFLNDSPNYTLLAQKPKLAATPGEGLVGYPDNTPKAVRFSNTHIIVLFRAAEDEINTDLVKRINATRKMYVSGTKWDGKFACRIAVSTWKVDVERDLKLVTDVLEHAIKGGS